MLQIVAQRLRACVKEGDTVARLGGDEFTMILRGVATADGAQRVAARIIEALQEAVNIGGGDHYVRASLRIPIFSGDGSWAEQTMPKAEPAEDRRQEDGPSP